MRGRQRNSPGTAFRARTAFRRSGSPRRACIFAPLPRNDFITRITIFGRDGEQARSVAEALGKSPFHNVTFYSGSFETVAQALARKAVTEAKRWHNSGTCIQLAFTSSAEHWTPSSVEGDGDVARVSVLWRTVL